MPSLTGVHQGIHQISTLDGTTAASSTADIRAALTESSAAVDAVIETLIDGIQGFGAAAAKADSPMQQQFMAMGAQRRRTTGDIIRIATDENMSPTTLDEGTASGALHRSWLSVREVIQGDLGLAAVALAGENHARRKLEDARNEGLPPSIAKVTRRALKEVDANIAKLESIAG
ncbi:MAG: PA2169 family four-helix-bundle protein [Acidimicrobiia bacterium]|nr:PA2169 family four-helix-bundle protein [Acidimicrobiia bacterium]